MTLSTVTAGFRSGLLRRRSESAAAVAGVWARVDFAHTPGLLLDEHCRQAVHNVVVRGVGTGEGEGAWSGSVYGRTLLRP